MPDARRKQAVTDRIRGYAATGISQCDPFRLQTVDQTLSPFPGTRSTIRQAAALNMTSNTHAPGVNANTPKSRLHLQYLLSKQIHEASQPLNTSSASMPACL
ncbi:hypothetical protein VOLCADRAFT_93936 [Volvox carteri f. nagariensis]|uniref:Uncharacterized protein n=1 Tax=Volvox carteri f. nagariensis TaxID=3068 RepID=D8U3G7_VOLCA|nr:uncharacterized protein VOLCADRAFT_93936 [Volvox carteri f. nagariensis]EFJ45752.1 hypothetical protein VOLCADRAFT_93936 [Volvox carteri f. nagariensis]|eukprot:XP_002953153.1 hypothetical protein VOLCADRAFT_93936 [Volvox carteri f. nagariensis]